MELSNRSNYLQVINKMIKLRRSYRELKSREEKIKNQMEYVQARVTEAVCNDKDENGRLVFSNDMHRRAAGTVRMYEDEEYIRLGEELESVRQFLSEVSDRYFLLQEKRNLLALDVMGEKAQTVMVYESKDLPSRGAIDSHREVFSGAVADLLKSDKDIRVDLRLNG